MQHPIHPERLAACFVGVGAKRTAATLAAEPRFAERLRLCAGRHYRLSPAPSVFASPDDTHIASLEREALEALALACGAAIWSAALAREIRGEAVAAIAERLGGAAMAASRRHRDLARDRELPDDLAALETLMVADGRACLASWIAEQPVETQAWLRLAWPSDAALPEAGAPDLLTHGVRVFRRLAADTGTA